MLAKFKKYQVGTVVHGLLVLVPFLGTIVRKGSTLLAAEFILLPYKDIEQDFIIVKREPEEWDDSLSRYSTKDLSNLALFIHPSKQHWPDSGKSRLWPLDLWLNSVK